MPGQIYGDPNPNYYNTALAQLISTYTDLVNKVQTQNNNIDQETQKFSQDHSTDYKKSFYENQSIEYLQNIYIYLFYIYLFFVLIIIFILIFNGKIYNFNMLALVVGLIIFPFYIYPLEQLLYLFFMYIYNFLTEQVFPNVYITTAY
jgi:hypothetical protein